jgi:hypothetical protein
VPHLVIRKRTIVTRTVRLHAIFPAVRILRCSRAAWLFAPADSKIACATGFLQLLPQLYILYYCLGLGTAEVVGPYRSSTRLDWDLSHAILIMWRLSYTRIFLQPILLCSLYHILSFNIPLPCIYLPRLRF